MALLFVKPGRFKQDPVDYRYYLDENDVDGTVVPPLVYQPILIEGECRGWAPKDYTTEKEQLQDRYPTLAHHC